MYHHNPYGLVLPAVNEVRKCIVSLLENLFILFYHSLYNILCLMLSFWFIPGFDENISLHFLYVLISTSGLYKEAQS